MACSEWEESALLYCSNELNKEKVASFESHIEECESCRTFFEQYKKENMSLFTVEVLGESPSDKINNELMRICENKRGQYTNVGLFSSVAKKSFVSISLFLVGFIVVGYFMMNIYQVGQNQESVAQENKSLNNPSTTNSSVNIANTTPDIDKGNDSISNLPDSIRYFSKNRGNLDLKGVVPVDLLNK